MYVRMWCQDREVSLHATMTDLTPRQTLQLTMRWLQDATSEDTGLDSSPRALNVIVYYIERVKRNKFYYAFLGIYFDALF